MPAHLTSAAAFAIMGMTVFWASVSAIQFLGAPGGLIYVGLTTLAIGTLAQAMNLAWSTQWLVKTRHTPHERDRLVRGVTLLATVALSFVYTAFYVTIIAYSLT